MDANPNKEHSSNEVPYTSPSSTTVLASYTYLQNLPPSIGKVLLIIKRTNTFKFMRPVNLNLSNDVL